MTKNEITVHETHCGEQCKYGDEDCPVAARYSMDFTKKQLLEDIEYLASRAKLANTIRFGESQEHSSCGTAANSLVSIAYGVESLENQHLPDDLASAERCVRAWDGLPAHRKPGPAKEAMVLILERRWDFMAIETRVP